jgi:hypothetical protein
MVVGGCFGNRADQAWRVHVDVWVGGRKDGIGGANDGADLLCGGRHDVVVAVDQYPVDGVAVTGQGLREDEMLRTSFEVVEGKGREGSKLG